MQCLCHHDVQGEAIDAALGALSAETEIDEQTRNYARRLCTRYLQDRERINLAIAESAQHWQLDRMSAVDRNVIRIALVELSEKAVPQKIIFNEAIEIGREFGSADSPDFINGVLQGAWNSLGAEG